MKTIKQFLISVILIALLTNPVFGYPGMGGNTSGARSGNITQSGSENFDLANATQSDQDIVLLQHLIEIDAVQFESQNKIYVRETILFKNIGEKPFSGTLRTWVPDGVVELKVGRVAMMMDSRVEQLNAIQNGNIISWQDNIKSNDPLTPLYSVEYVLSSKPEGTLSRSRYYQKKLVYPTLVNKVPLNIILKVTKGSGETLSVKDENGGSISSSGKPVNDENGILFSWETPEFKEINIELSKSAIDLQQMALYLIIGLLLVLVLAYPVIRKKSPRLQEIEEKIRNSMKKEPSNEEKQDDVEEITEEEQEEENNKEVEESPPEQKELSGKTNGEHEVEKNDLISNLEKLEKDYASGNLIDEEYEELRNTYQERLRKLKEG